MKVYTFDVGYEVEHVTIEVAAETQEQAEAELTRLVSQHALDGDVVDFWVNGVESEQVGGE